MSARTTGSFCSHTVQPFIPALRGAVSAPAARRMSLLDDAGIFTRMLLMEAREQAKSGGRPSHSPQASGHRGERVITSKRPPWNSGTAVPRTLYRPSTTYPRAMRSRSRAVLLHSNIPATLMHSRIPSRPMTTITGSLTSRPSTQLLGRPPKARGGSRGSQTARERNESRDGLSELTGSCALPARPASPFDELAPPMPTLPAAIGRGGMLKRFVDNSDAFAHQLNVQREDALFDGPGLGGSGGEGAPASSLGIGSVSELLQAQKYEHAMEKAMEKMEKARPPSDYGRSGAKRSLRDCAPPWWPIPPPFVEAAEKFDARLRTQHTRADRLLRHLIADKTSLSKDAVFDEAIFELRSTKFVPPIIARLRREIGVGGIDDSAPGGSSGGPGGGSSGHAASSPRGRPKVRAARNQQGGWDPETSIWAPRKKWCDAKSLYDTEDVERLKLNLDWSRALACGLQKFIVKNDDDDAGADADGDGMPDEVEEVLQVLYAHRSTFFRLFDYYASLGGDTIGSISQNGKRLPFCVFRRFVACAKDVSSAHALL